MSPTMSSKIDVPTPEEPMVLETYVAPVQHDRHLRAARDLVEQRRKGGAWTDQEWVDAFYLEATMAFEVREGLQRLLGRAEITQVLNKVALYDFGLGPLADVDAALQSTIFHQEVYRADRLVQVSMVFYGRILRQLLTS